jgi:hypothetical protein
LLAEGSIGRANQNFVAAQFDRARSFPGLGEAQRLAVRDEVRHIGIGVSYAERPSPTHSSRPSKPTFDRARRPTDCG